MDLENSRFLVAGATGALGRAIACELVSAGAHVACAGRDATALADIGARLDAPVIPLELRSPDGPATCVAAAQTLLGGLDGLVIATGVVAFGAAHELPEAVATELFETNVLGPLALMRAALPSIEALAVVSAVVADHPTAGMAAYSASKSALSAYVSAVRRERRRDGLHVLDVRPGHLDTGLETRALFGSPPRLPAGGDHRDVAAAIVQALREDRDELAYDLMERALVAS